MFGTTLRQAKDDAVTASSFVERTREINAL
jgi:hypothetical protein